MTRTRRSPEAARNRKANVRALAKEPSPRAFKHCTVFGCDKPSQRFAGKGLSEKYCTKHVRHEARHGSAHVSSFTAPELKPFLWAANRFLKESTKDQFVIRTLAALQGMMDGAGKPEIATRLRGLDAKRRARNALARMRVRGVEPARLLAIVLATHAILRADQSFSHRGLEFLHVQIGKQAHRLAARFTPTGMEGLKSAPGQTLQFGHEVHPYSAGHILRELGKALDETAGLLAEQSIERILKLKIERWGNQAPRETMATKTLPQPVKSSRPALFDAPLPLPKRRVARA
jgi:hypothetical protein